MDNVRFLCILTTACLISGIFTKHPVCSVRAKPSTKTVVRELKNETNGVCSESNASSSSITAGEANSQNSVPSTAPIDYGRLFETQLTAFLDGWSKMLNSLPKKPIVKITASSFPEGLKKIFSFGDKIYPGFSSLAHLFISSSIGGSECPGVAPDAPCYVLLFPHKHSVVPLVCFRAMSDSIVVKNLQSEANKKGDYQLIHPLPLKEKAYNAWIYGSKTLLASFKDFSTVAPFFYGKEAKPKSTFAVELDIGALSTFMPFPVLKCVYDTYVRKDFEKIIYGLDIGEEQLRFSSRYQAKPKTPWAIYCKTIRERKRGFRSLNFPSEANKQTALFLDPPSLKNLLKALSNYANEAEWKQDPIAYQTYRWGRLLYPLLKAYLDFAETVSTGNGQFYRLDGGRYDGFWFEELNPSVMDETLVTFLKSFTEKCAKQLALASKEGLLGSDCFKDPVFEERVLADKGCNIHKCALKVQCFDGSTEFAVFAGLHRGYLLYANSLENMRRLLDQMQAIPAFSYCHHPDWITLSRIKLRGTLFGISLGHAEGAVEVSSNVELTPETFVTAVSIPLSFIKAVCASFVHFDVSNSGNEVKVEEKTKKATESAATEAAVQQSDIAKLTNKHESDTSVSDKVILEKKPTLP